MRPTLIITIWLLFFAGYGQTVMFHSMPSFSMIYYKYYLEFAYDSNTIVDPYHSIFIGEARAKNDHKPISMRPLEANIRDKRNYWFDYAPERQEIYQQNGGLTYTDMDLIKDSLRQLLPPTCYLNCSRITNSKGDIVFIYFTTISGPDKVERMNPCLAFEALEHNNTTAYWDPPSFMKHISTVVRDYDLEKGTYFFNWWDEVDILNKAVHSLWTLKKQYHTEIQMIRAEDDSLRSLYRKTNDHNYLEKANILNFGKTVEEYNQKKAWGYSKIIQLGYGNKQYFEEHKTIRFEIRKEALLSHKISNKAVSPEQLSSYLSKPKKKRPKTVNRLLEIFVTN